MNKHKAQAMKKYEKEKHGATLILRRNYATHSKKQTVNNNSAWSAAGCAVCNVCTGS